jgi:hypothetical protein
MTLPPAAKALAEGLLAALVAAPVDAWRLNERGNSGPAAAVAVGFDRIVVSEIEIPNQFASMA